MINERDFLNSLDEVIDKKDKVIVLYSGLWTFIDKIKFKTNKKEKIPQKILRLIEKKIGKNRTLFIPSFSGKEFQRNKIFDIKKTIDKENGILSKIALKKYYRTRQPIHSYLVFGNTKVIRKLNLKSSWGKQSLLEFFSKKNARICNLGLPWNQGCAYLHRFEELYKVPWRFQKTYTGKLKKNNKIIGVCSEIKYCTPIDVNIKYDFKPFIKKIENSYSFKKTKNKLFKFESIKTSCLDKIGKNVFKINPWIIIKNKKRTKSWIKYNKSKSISF